MQRQRQLTAIGPDQARMSLALWLRQGRAQRGMSVDDVAKVTKIQVRILEMLETGKFDRLPADVFVRGFVRSVARCVGLDANEALQRYLACSRTEPTAAARALVETMSELAPSTAKGEPTYLRTLEPASASPDDVISAPVEPEIVFEAPIMEETPVVVETVMLPPTGTLVEEAAAAGEEAPKKKRTRKPKASGQQLAEGTDQTPTVKRTRKKAVSGDQQTIPGTEETAAKPARKKKGPRSSVVGPRSETVTEGIDVAVEDLAASSIEMAAASANDMSAAESDAADLAALPLAKDERPKTEDQSSAADDFWSPEAAEAATSLTMPAASASSDSMTMSAAEAEAVQETASESITTTGSWSPKMPAPVPWRRPSMYAAQQVPVVPSLVIDDADPEMAEREREERVQARSARRSFLPPILRDLDDRSARQGGLTLAVIILLIAATLTLSYLMRRPSSSGDGVTLNGAPDVPTLPSTLA